MVVIAFVSCTLAIQAAATRLIFSYAGDEMIFGWRPLSTVSRRFHMPPGAVAVAAIIPAAITLLSGQIVARIITFAVVGIYISFQLVVVASLLARQRGWRLTGAVANPGLFDRRLVPLSAAIVAAVGLTYLFVFQPKAVVRPDARADGGSGEEPVEAPAVPAH
jgi:amino acid transporter